MRISVYLVGSSLQEPFLRVLQLLTKLERFQLVGQVVLKKKMFRHHLLSFPDQFKFSPSCQTWAHSIKIFYAIVISGRNIQPNCKHLQTDARVRTLIKDNQAKLNQLRLAYKKHLFNSLFLTELLFLLCCQKLFSNKLRFVFS